MCIHDCLHDPGSGLSQDQSFNLTWHQEAHQSVSCYRVLKTVCLCLVGILYVVHPVFSFTATVLKACTVSSLYVKTESEERPLRLFTMILVSIYFLLITEPLWIYEAQGN